MPKYILLVSIMISLSGCISVSPISTSADKIKSRIGHEQVVIRVYEDPRAKTVTTGTVLGAGIIDDMTKPEGDAHPEPSPGLLIATDLRNHMISNLLLNVDEIPSNTLPRKPKDNPPQKNTP